MSAPFAVPARTHDEQRKLAFHGIEGLRACAALSVMLAHATALSGRYPIPHAVNNVVFLGLHGLTLFFCLSGFLLYVPFVQAMLGGGALPSVRTFYRHRFARIAPAYLVIFVLASLVFGAVVVKASAYGEPPGLHVGRLTDTRLFVLNLFLLQGYVPSGVLTGLSVSWSLLPEVIFYLVLPGLALIGARLGGRLRAEVAALVPALGLAILGTAGRLYSQHLTTTGPGGVVGYTYRNTGATWSAVVSHSFIAQADLFGYGMVAAVLVAIARRRGARPQWLRTAASAAVALGLAVIVVTHQQDRSDPYIGLVCAGSIILVVTATSGLWRRIGRALELPVPRRLGVISYSIYLWHFPVVIFLGQHLAQAQDLGQAMVRIALVCVVSIALAEVTYRLVEAPAMRRARRVERPTRSVDRPETDESGEEIGALR